MCCPTNTPSSLNFRRSLVAIRTTPSAVAGAAAAASDAFLLSQQQQRHHHQEQQQQHQLRDARLGQLNDYQRFLIFIKIMFKIMEHHEEYHLVAHATSIIDICWKNHIISTATLAAYNNRNNIYNDSNYNDSNNDSNTDMSTFQEDVIVRLRCIINELYWNLTREYLGYGCD